MCLRVEMAERRGSVVSNLALCWRDSAVTSCPGDERRIFIILSIVALGNGVKGFWTLWYNINSCVCIHLDFTVIVDGQLTSMNIKS
jgi:hypothetical protein